MVRELVKQSMRLLILTSRRVRTLASGLCAGWADLVAEAREGIERPVGGTAHNGANASAKPRAKPAARASRRKRARAENTGDTREPAAVPKAAPETAQRRDRGPRRRGRSPGPGRVPGGSG
jgi:hypothetical protein